MAVAVDAMGGDLAPTATVRGSAHAATHEWCPPLVLVGDEAVIEPLLNEELAQFDEPDRTAARERIRLHHASQIVAMDDSAALAMRRKPDSSIARCIELAGAGEADAIVTAGHTGATVAAATRALPLAAVKRPGIAVTLPSKNKVSTIIDVGANVHCKPAHLFDYGVMATEFCRATLGIDNPSVGLMNVGEEDDKGNELVRQTMELFRQSDLNFIGNIEGQDAFSGKCDIIVCEGFVGNVVLKVSEGFAEMTSSWLDEAVASRSPTGDQKAVWEEALRVFKEHTDYSNYGGALLLGVNTTCVIGHGRSGAAAISNAIRSAARFVECGVKEQIIAGLESHHKQGLPR